MVGLFFQIAFMLLVLKLSPYKNDLDDISSFISSLTLSFTLFVGVVLAMNSPTNPTVDSLALGSVLTALTVMCVISQIFTTLASTERGAQFLAKCNKGVSSKQIGDSKVAPSPT